MRLPLLAAMLLLTAAPSAGHQPPHVPPFTANAPQEDRVGKLSIPRNAPFVFTLGRGPEGVDRCELLQELQLWTDMICGQARIPGLVTIELGSPEGGSWNALDGINWIWWDEVVGDVGAMITDHGGHEDAWWRAEVADCVFNTWEGLSINWRICNGPTSDSHDIDIGTVWGHELMHILGADHAVPCDANNSIMAENARVCCEDAFGPLPWDQIYLDRLHLHLLSDIGEDGNSYPATPLYLGPLACFEPGSYDGFGLYDSYLYIMDHDIYSLQLNYAAGYPWLFHVYVDVGESVDATIKLRVRPESGPEVTQTAYATYHHPGEVFVELTGPSGREFTVSLHELGHWGTEQGMYLVYFELFSAVQSIGESDGLPEGQFAAGENPGDGRTAHGLRTFQAFDVEGRLVHQAQARTPYEFQRSPALMDRLARHPQGTLMWRSLDPQGGRERSRGKFLYLKGARQ
jgi:hypothetical protein